MPILKNRKHESIAQLAAKGEGQTAIAKALGVANRQSVDKVLKRPEVAARVAELQRAAAEKTTRNASEVLDGLWAVADAMKSIATGGKKGTKGSSRISATAAAQSASRAYELLGRYYRLWSPDDGADTTADHIPLAERLKQYAREQAIDEAPNVTRIKPDVRSA